MRFGLGVLRLAPDAFWAMSPRELHAAAQAIFGAAGAAPDRRALDELLRRFPDTRNA